MYKSIIAAITALLCFFSLLSQASDVITHRNIGMELARDLGGLPAMAYTHTCYNGDRPPCGRCPACVLRAKGFAEASIVDPLLASA